MVNENILMLTDRMAKSESEMERKELKLKIETELYSHGQDSVLKDVAFNEYMKFIDRSEEEQYISPAVREAELKSRVNYEGLKSKLDDVLKKELLEFDDSMVDLMAEKEEWFYIQGFLAGYHFSQKARG